MALIVPICHPHSNEVPRSKPCFAPSSNWAINVFSSASRRCCISSLLISISSCCIKGNYGYSQKHHHRSNNSGSNNTFFNKIFHNLYFHDVNIRNGSRGAKSVFVVRTGFEPVSELRLLPPESTSRIERESRPASQIITSTNVSGPSFYPSAKQFRHLTIYYFNEL
jgi:hypothetical protein